jgi:hypothetical protein
MNVDTSKWSGEGEFTQLLVEHLRQLPGVAGVRVEDAPATRSEADYNFISNELFIEFVSEAHVELRLRRSDRTARLRGRRHAPVLENRADHPAVSNARLQDR